MRCVGPAPFQKYTLTVTDVSEPGDDHVRQVW